jgi:two-component system LytT family response regulator
VIRVDGKIVFLRNSEVEWIEAAANYLRIPAGQRVFLARNKISDFEKTLAPEKFVRIHPSLIVNLAQSLKYRAVAAANEWCSFVAAKELPLGQTYREVLGGLVKNSC